MSLQIRPATEADWPLLWPIWHEVVAAGDTYTYEPDTSESRAKALWIDVAGAQTWLAESVELGVLGVYKITANQAGPGSHVANGSYMVAASARGHGVGRALVTHSLMQAAAAGYRAVQFNAVAETNRGAIKLYEQLGFVVVGRIPGGFLHPQQGYVDLLVMHRAVDAETGVTERAATA